VLTRWGSSGSGTQINHERMPVLLTREEPFETWLRGSPDEAFALKEKLSTRLELQ
jgi:putative SOS response-associated peptidase YedK